MCIKYVKLRINRQIKIKKSNKISEKLLTKMEMRSRIKTSKEEKTSQTGGQTNEIDNFISDL